VLQQEVESKDGLTYYSWYVVLLHKVASTAHMISPPMTTCMLQILCIKQTCPKTHVYQKATICWHCKVSKAQGFALLQMQGAEASQTSDSHSSEESAHSVVYHCKCQTMAKKSRSSEAHVEVLEHCDQNMMRLV